MMIRKCDIPWLELNVVLLFCGFSFFTTVVYGDDLESGSKGNLLSIIYRVLACVLSVFCIYKGEGVPTLKMLKGALLPYSLVALMMTIRLVYDLFISMDSHTWSSNTKLMNCSMFFCTVIVSNLSVVCTFRMLDWEKIMKMVFCTLLYINIMGLISSWGMSERLALNSHQSTLAYGANGAYLTIVSVAYLAIKWYDIQKKWIKLILVFGLVLGVVSVFRAASRGPLFGLLLALAAIVATKRNILYIIIGVTAISMMLGKVIDLYIKANASIMYVRVMDTLEKGDTSGRTVLYAKAIGYLKEFPLTGAVFSIREGIGGACGPHNYVLHVAMASGVLGLTLILICYFCLFRDSLRLKNINTVESRFFVGTCFYFFIRTMTGVNFYSSFDFVFVMVCVSLYPSKNIS